MNTRSQNHVPWLALLLLVAGVVLRLLLHDYHGVEGDGSFSLALSRLTLAEMFPELLRLELDVHPPLHALVLKGWIALAGESMLALRMLNLLLSLLSISLVIDIARRLGRPEAALLALLWAVNPVLFLGMWLVRMYALLGALAAAAAWAATRAEGRGFWGWALVAVLLGLAALYTHLTGAIVLGAAGALLLVRAWRRGWGAVGGVLALLALAGVLYLPFAIPMLEVYRTNADLGATVNPAYAVPPWQVPAAVMSAALAFRAELSVWVMLMVGLLLAALDVVPAWQARRQAPATLGGLAVRPGALRLGGAVAWGGYLLAGVAYLGLVGLGVAGDLFRPRYVAPFVPLLLLPVVWGTGRVLRRDKVAGAALVVLLVATGLFGLQGTLARDWRDDWTGAAAWVETHTLPGDVVVVVPDWGQEAFRYHYDGVAPVRGFFPRITPALDLDAAFGPYVDPAQRAWLVRYQPDVSDPEGLAQDWLTDRCPPVTRAFPAGMQVSLLACERVFEALPEGVPAADITFGDVLALRGVQAPQMTTAAQDTRLYDESGRVLVALYWEALQAAPPAAPRVQLTTPGGAVYGGALPDVGAVPVENWQLGQIVVAYYDLNVNPATPPGIYNIEVMALGPDGAPLPAAGPGAGQNWYIAGQVAVE